MKDNQVKLSDIADDEVYTTRDKGEYFMVVTKEGNMQCSCGAPLNKLDDYTYKCSGGYPIYRPDAGEVIIDKFGNVMLKILPHGEGQTNQRSKK